MHDSPSLIRFALTDGRTIQVRNLRIQHLFEGVLSSSHERVSQYALQRIASDFKGQPTVVLDHIRPLPVFQFEADLSSFRSEPGQALEETRLRAFWWMNKVPKTLTRIVAPLREIEWDAHSQVFDWDNI